MTAVTLTATFTTGTFTWTCPAGVTSVTVACTGAGGGGGAAAAASGSNGGGGGGGEAALEPAVAVTPGLSYGGIAGAAGAAGISGGNGSAGGDSSFTGDSVTVTAGGGAGGNAGTTGDGQPGPGGNISANLVTGAGGDGDNGTHATNGGGGGGAAGVSLTAGFPGNDGSGSTAGAASGGTWPGGAGGAGSTSGAGTGAAGSAPGGGGGGALSTGTARRGGAGAAGQVVITWTQNDPVLLTASTAGGTYTFTAPAGATAVKAEAWGGGAGGYNTTGVTASSLFLCGATVHNLYGLNSDVAIANTFDGYVGRPLATTTAKFYYNETGGDAIISVTGVNHPQPIGDMVAAGCFALLCVKPNRNYAVTDDGPAMQTALQFYKDNLPANSFAVVLWQECNGVGFFPSASAYHAYWAHYRPYVPSGIPVLYNPRTAAGIPSAIAYCPTAGVLPDQIGLDYYGNEWKNGVYLTYPPGDPDYPGFFDFADSLGLPAGLYEFGNSSSVNTTLTPAQWDDFINGAHGILTILRARVAAGAPNGPWVYFGSQYNTNNNTIFSSSDYKCPDLREMYDFIASASAGQAGGAGGGGGEYAAESSLAISELQPYTLAAGAGGADREGGTASTVTGQSVTVTAHGGSAPTTTGTGGAGGTGSSNTTHHNGGAGGHGGTQAGGAGGGGGSGGTSAAGNAGASSSTGTGGAGGAAVTGGGPGGRGGNISQIGLPPVTGPGGGGGGAGAGGQFDGAGRGGQVKLSNFVTHPSCAGGIALAPLGFSGAAATDAAYGGVGLRALGFSGSVTVTGGAGSVSCSGGLGLAPLGLRGLAVAGVPPGSVFTSGGIGLRPLGFQGPSRAVSFPADPLPIMVELLINGVWTDISGDVYQRAGITISGRGRPDEAATAQPTQVTLTLNNRGGGYSPANTSGQYYPYLTRNTQIRISVVNAISALGATCTGYRFWGEVPAWPPLHDETGTDVYVPITAAGVLQRMNQSRTLGSPLYRYYNQRYNGSSRTPGIAPIAGYWSCEDGGGVASKALQSTSSFASSIPGGSPMAWTGGTPNLAADSSAPGSSPFAQLNGTTWAGIPGAFSAGGITFTESGTFTWTCPAGVTSVTAECWGAGGGAGNGANGNGGAGGAGGEYASQTVAVTPGKDYTVVVGAGGSGGAGSFSLRGNGGQAGGSSAFKGDSVTVRAHGGQGAPGGPGHANGGTGSTSTIHNDGGDGAAQSGHFGGNGGGSSGGPGNNGHTGSQSTGTPGAAGGNSVVDGGPGGTGGNGATAAQGNQAQPGFMPVPGPGGGGGGGGFSSYNDYAKPGGGGQVGQVTLSFGTTVPKPHANTLRAVIDVPSTGGVDGSYLVQALTGGDVADLHVIYHTGGNLELAGKDIGGTQLFTSGSVSYGLDGQVVMVSAELTQKSASTIAWKLTAITPGASSVIGTQSGTISGTLGSFTDIKSNSHSPVDTGATGVGHIAAEYFVDPILNLSDAFNGYAGELAADRFVRLCGEQNVPVTLTGNAAGTPQMGVQQSDLLVNLLKQCEAADQGQMLETRDAFGLGYVTRVAMQNQSPAATLDYSAADLSPPIAPTDDDQLLRNDIVASRVNGSSFEASLATGALSILDPPSGVGLYSYPVTVNLFADAQLENFANWLLTLGTVGEFRFPLITIDLTRPELADAAFAAVPGLDITSYLKIVNPPADWPPGDINQLCYGFTETLNAFTWTIEVNAVPADPWTPAPGSSLPTW